MKRWAVTYTLNAVHFEEEHIEGKTYTEAYINMMVKRPDAIITDIKEV